VLTYALVDAATEEVIDELVFRLDSSSQQALQFRGLVPSRDPWLFESPYEFKIKVTLGAQEYQVVYSEPFEVAVVETCDLTQLIPVSLGPYIVGVNDGFRLF